MSASRIKKIGILAPRPYRQLFGLTYVRRSFQKSFPHAEQVYIEEADLRSSHLEDNDLLVLPPSIDGEDTPYRHFLKGIAAHNLEEYAQYGRIASFCSGTWALLNNISYTFNNGTTREFKGYVPVLDCDGIGPIDRDSSMRIVTVFSGASNREKAINLCYDGGPALQVSAGANPDMRPLAYFEDGQVSVLAVRKPYKGTLVAFSALADMRAQDVPAQGVYAETHRRLGETEQGHNALWNRAMAILETRSLDADF